MSLSYDAKVEAAAAVVVSNGKIQNGDNWFGTKVHLLSGLMY